MLNLSLTLKVGQVYFAQYFSLNITGEFKTH